MHRTTSITVERGETYHPHTTRPFRTVYACTGPDGRKIGGHTNLAGLRALLRRHYGAVELVIVDGPTWRKKAS